MASALNPLLGYAAGALTILSPCVLPLVPIVLAGAARAHRLGPLALAAGLVVSFTGVGFVLAAAGDSLGVDGDGVRLVGAAAMVLAGLVLVIPAFQRRVTRWTTPLAAWAGQRQQGLERFGLAGQAMIGVLLGAVWSPCVGPTLGAATVLAAQGSDLGEVAATMAAFGLGIASVLVLLGTATRAAFARWRGRLVSTGGSGKRVLGWLIILTGALILTGTDRVIEGVLVAASPDWLNDLTTAI